MAKTMMNFYIEPIMRKQLAQVAARMKKTSSEIVRLAVKQYLEGDIEEEGEEEKPTVEQLLQAALDAYREEKGNEFL